MEFVDTHCHAHFRKFGLPSNEVYQKALAAGVNRMICVGTTLDDSFRAIEFADSHKAAWASVGVHPHEAQDFLDAPDAVDRFKAQYKQAKVVAIGEIGLDFYKSQTPTEVQEKALRTQIEAGLSAGLPFIFHVRDGWRDFWRIFDDYQNLSGVVHSFSSGTKQLNAALERGLFVGLNGIMTFTRDQAQLDAAKQVPLERLLLETDAPFLTPVPFRGDVCEPRHVVAVAEFLAELRQESIEELSKITTNNAVKLFDLK